MAGPLWPRTDMDQHECPCRQLRIEDRELAMGLTVLCRPVATIKDQCPGPCWPEETCKTTSCGCTGEVAS